MNDLEITARTSGTLNVNKPLVQPLIKPNNRVTELDNIMDNLNKPIPSGVGINQTTDNLGQGVLFFMQEKNNRRYSTSTRKTISS